MKKHIFKIGVAAVAVLVALAVIFNPFFPVDRFITDRIYSFLPYTVIPLLRYIVITLFLQIIIERLNL